MKIVFFGTSSFAATILQELLQQKLDIVAVVTRPDKPQGRSLKVSAPPVKELLLKHTSALPLFQPAKASTPEFATQLRALSPDVFIVAAYGEIMKNLLLEIPSLGPINVHGSILPAYRGAAPIQRCLMQGARETGVTIMRMVLEMDAGDILEIVKMPLTPEATFGELEQQLAYLACPALLRVLANLEKGAQLSIPQDLSLVTYAPKITPAETEIAWSRSATELHNLIRALSPQPSAWCWVQIGREKKRLKIKRTTVVPSLQGSPGTNLVLTSQEWVVACGQGGLKILELQLEGKKSLAIGDFLRGLQVPCQILISSPSSS